ncbi:MAG: GGDEF domain-containing protein, partial [Planctomycetota bacterium]
QSMEALTGWPAVEMVGRAGNRIRVPSDGSSLDAAPLYDGVIPAVRGSRRMDLTVNCRDGRRLELNAEVQRLAGPGERIQVTTLSVLSLSPTDKSTQGLEHHDSLTGLLDADAFAARLTSEFADAATSAKPLALVIADVDRLRSINDAHGHAAGDDVLRRLAGILRVAIERDDLLFHLGDDDFAILLPGAGRGDARQVAAGIRSTVERYHFRSQDADSRVTLSLGAASFPADAENGSDLLERAGDALDEARSMGRNRVWCYLRRPRVPLEVPVYFDGVDSLLVGYTRDLSPSGIFVQTSAPVEIGMRCALNFPLPGHDGRVHVIGRVVRTVPAPITSDEQAARIPGMGVEFERFSGRKDRRVIESFLHANESATLRPEDGTLSIG